ncbi:MAG: phospholipase D-like domain-containing protein [Chloroflexia bacterium]
MAGKARSRKVAGKSPWRRFLREWGIYLLIGVAIGLLIFLLGRGGGKAGLATTTPYRVYFTRGTLGHPKPAGLEAELVADVASAGRWVEVVAPAFDLPELAQALIAAHGRGVRAQVVEDEASQADPAVLAVTTRLREAGVPVLLRPHLGGSFLAVDGRVVWAGSWDLSRRGLEEADGVVLRWELAPLAADFHAEFTEIVLESFAGGLFRPPTALKTLHPYLAIPDGASISVYMTPADAALSEVLQSLARAQEVIMVIGKVNDPRLADRLIGEASLSTMLTTWAVLDEGGTDPGLLLALAERKVNLGRYAGAGLDENVLVVDGQTVILFSQPMDQQAYDRNQGYVLVVRDRDLGQALQQEFARLYAEAQKGGP